MDLLAARHSAGAGKSSQAWEAMKRKCFMSLLLDGKTRELPESE
jgi:hypothetical protein